MDNPTRLRWFCPVCNDEHSITDTRAECLKIAGELMGAGVLMVAVYDEAYAIMCDQDRAEDAVGIGVPRSACVP